MTLQLTIIGSGMITNDLILPCAYHLQRLGMIETITITATHSASLKSLSSNEEFKLSFPNQSFIPIPDLNNDAKPQPERYKQVLRAMPPYNAVIIATPDQLHYEMIIEALKCNQHVLCVKPLVLKYNQAVEIEKMAFERGLFVGIEYHKRFDRRALYAKRQYELRKFGTFVMGEGKLIEPYYYRHSNFQNWFTADQTDPFVYVGCHYTDQVYYITGLKPIEVSVKGVKGKFPNGKEAFMWSNGRIVYENGAIFSVTNGLGYPDEAAGSNEQGIVMYFEGNDKNGYLRHNDQFRGVEHNCLEDHPDPKNDIKPFRYINPDFFRMLPWEGPGYKPTGYGYDSIEASIKVMTRIQHETINLNHSESLTHRQAIIKEINAKGIIATPANSSINELVTEAARMSILNDGIPVKIIYGILPHIQMN